MIRHPWFLVILVLILGMIVAAGSVSATPPRAVPTLTPTPKSPSHIASPEELLQAQTQWSRSRHSDTFDNNLGANTTCAQCKSPRNWDPHAPAAEAAHDCASCKREPGKPRPQLTGGVPVPQPEWTSITCDICHQKVGNSYSTALSFWNQDTRAYEPMAASAQLCEKCHIGTHGFDVINEQATSPAHKGWECTRCHGSHNSPVQCTDCHDPAQGLGTDDHSRHPKVDCTACHDAGNLTIWQDPYSESRFYQIYMPQRSAHDLRSWPSHNIQLPVDCRRCHHPQGTLQSIVASDISCKACHPDGASFDWCPQFPRDKAPEPVLP